MAKRQSITTKTRFEIFKRDSFTCQYCGRSAPEIVLQVDHIMPVSKGGDNDITNLITSCDKCNAGKSDRELSDDAVIAKRKKQLDELQARREQLEMMAEWHKSLLELKDDEINVVYEVWKAAVPGYSINQNAVDTVREWLNKYGLELVLDSLKTSVAQYLKFENGEPTRESVNKAYLYIPRICSVKKYQVDTPYIKDAFYIRGIVRNRMYCNEWKALQLIKDALQLGAEVSYLKDIALKASNWTAWREEMEIVLEVFKDG